MSSPIHDLLKESVTLISDAAYKRGYIQAQLDMSAAIKAINPEMIDPKTLLELIVTRLGDIQTPAKAPKPRAKKVSA